MCMYIVYMIHDVFSKRSITVRDLGLTNKGRYCLLPQHNQVYDKKNTTDSLHVDACKVNILLNHHNSWKYTNYAYRKICRRFWYCNVHRRKRQYCSQLTVCLSYTANPNICTVHLINDGVTVNGNTATVEFASSGPATTFQCSLDGQGFTACELVQVIHALAKLIPNAIDVHECLVCAVPGIIAILVSQIITIVVLAKFMVSLEDVS